MGSHLILRLDAVSESCHIGIYMSHRNTSCHIRLSCFTHVNESCHVGMTYVTRMNESHRGHVLQCVAMSCNVLQCVAVCCSVMCDMTHESHRGHVTWDLHGQPSYSQALHI